MSSSATKHKRLKMEVNKTDCHKIRSGTHNVLREYNKCYEKERNVTE